MCFSKKVQAKKNSQNWCSQQIAAELGVFFPCAKGGVGFGPKSSSWETVGVPSIQSSCFWHGCGKCLVN